MKIQIEIPKKNLMFVSVPDSVDKCEIISYGFAGIWLMESNSKKLNPWKMRLPAGRYEVIGRIKDVVVDNSIENLSEIETDKNFIIRCIFTD